MWRTFAGPTTLTDIKLDHLQDYPRWLERRGDRPQNIRHNLRLAKRVLRWCVDHGYLERTPRAPANASKVARTPKPIHSDHIRVQTHAVGEQTHRPTIRLSELDQLERYVLQSPRPTQPADINRLATYHAGQSILHAPPAPAAEGTDKGSDTDSHSTWYIERRQVTSLAARVHDLTAMLESLEVEDQRYALSGFCKRIVADAETRKIVVETDLAGLAQEQTAPGITIGWCNNHLPE